MARATVITVTRAPFLVNSQKEIGVTRTFRDPERAAVVDETDFA